MGKERQRGVEVRIIDLEPLSKQASEWLTERRLDLVEKGVIGVAPNYAPWGVFKDALGNDVVICNEGVAFLLSPEEPVSIPMHEVYEDENKFTFSVWEAPLTVEYLAEHTTDETLDLADFVRTFGARLEDNFRGAHALAINERAAKTAVEQWQSA